MDIKLQLTTEPIPENIACPFSNSTGAWVEFRGRVRGEENGQSISALEYEGYAPMAEREMRRLIEDISLRHPVFGVVVVHRIGIVPAGQAAVHVGVAAKHRGPAFALLAEFMDRLKQDVPIWKRRAIQAPVGEGRTAPLNGKSHGPGTALTLDAALAEIRRHVQPLPANRVALDDAFGGTLRENVFTNEDSPLCDCSTRDGYAILAGDDADEFSIVDTLYAADWKPRQLQRGESVRVATGTALPCENLQVVTRENVEASGGRIRILHREKSLNLRRRGEEWRSGKLVLSEGAKLEAGTLALLASVGCFKPLASPRLRIAHFTTGDEIVPPAQALKPGQVRNSNSIFIRASLQRFRCDLQQAHLPEDFEQATNQISQRSSAVGNADVVLISGGASVGEKDFTRDLLEWLGFEIIFSQVNVRPGRPLIFGVNGNRIAFGLPGNPLSHFACFHLFVATALAGLVGAEPASFRRGRLAAKLDDASNSRETLWPAKMELDNGVVSLTPQRWNSSGDMTCLAEANALIRVPPDSNRIEAGAEVQFLPA